MKNFKQLLIWSKGIDICVKCFELVKKFPDRERFGLALQITRAASSIPSNIAEGSSRNSEKDYYRFLEIAPGSCFELETHLAIVNQINYGDADLRQEIIEDIDEEEKMIMRFQSRLFRS